MTTSTNLLDNIPHMHTLLYEYFYLIPVVILIPYVVYQRFFSSLAGIPGPFLASLTPWWLVRTIRQHNFHREIQRLHEKYGPIVRIRPNEVSVSDLSAIRKVYSTH